MAETTRQEPSKRGKGWRRARQAALALVGVAFGLGLGWLAIRGAEWSAVREALGNFPPGYLAAALGLVLLSAYVRALRWRLCWVDARISTLRLFAVENAALGLNNLSPVRALEEGAELTMLSLRDRWPAGQVVATMMMARIQDLAFTLAFITVALVIVPALFQFTPAIVGAFVFFGAWLVLLLKFGAILRRFPRLRELQMVATFERALHLISAQRRRMVLTFTLTCAYWLLLGPVGWVIARGLGLDLPFHLVLVSVIGSIFFSTAVPGLPGAVGTFEFGMATLMGLFDVPQHQALSFAVLVHGVLFVPTSVIAAVVLPREGLGSVRAIRDLVERRGQAHHNE